MTEQVARSSWCWGLPCCYYCTMAPTGSQNYFALFKSHILFACTRLYGTPATKKSHFQKS